MAVDAIIWKLSKLCASSSDSELTSDANLFRQTLAMPTVTNQESWFERDPSMKRTVLFNAEDRASSNKRASSMYYRPSRFTIGMGQGSTLFEPRAKSVRATLSVKADFGNFDSSSKFRHFRHRHREDAKFVTHYDMNAVHEKKKAMHHFLEAEPSYTRFKVPFQIACAERYKKNIKKYNQQFRREIAKLVDNQSSARDATYFVRMVSYTTLWPPYHNERELYDTSNNFFRLTPAESARLQYIMSTDFSYH
ncbi:hypothetical protein AWZ03_005566 [Drosophila navojoa]|uniref:Uncharacterized protein n=1 Tax=Drosophila navojoa TaxID=7232 RepID=A0A484BGR4_DRONA|nr:uncharacterized protein LOC108652077 [Drosophila navojoa]TDG47948.1 hypothetical protein AWZ03_005566 [Drosophila navojoa]